MNRSGRTSTVGSWLLGRDSPALRPEDVATWCDDVARRSRAGVSLRAALVSSTSDEPALQRATEPIRHALDRGATVARAAEMAGARTIGGSGGEHLALAWCVIEVVASVGGSAAAPLERVAAALRLRAVDRDDRATQAAQARMSAHVLTTVPLVMLALLLAVDSGVRATVLAPAGATCVLTGCVLNVVGWCWMRRIIAGAR